MSVSDADRVKLMLLGMHTWEVSGEWVMFTSMPRSLIVLDAYHQMITGNSEEELIRKVLENL